MKKLAELMAVQPDQDYDEYAAAPGVRSGVLKHMEQSPAHAREAHLHPKTGTPALDRGSAQHTLIFEPQLWDERFIVAPAIDRRYKDGKAAWAEFEEKAAGRTILRPEIKGDRGEKVDEFRAMAEAARSHETFGKMLETGKSEVSMFGEVEGLLLKCRWDWICQWEGWTTMVEYKTTARSADWSPFRKQIIALGYDFVQGHYELCTDQAHPGPQRRYIFVAHETYPPYALAIYELDELWREYAKDRVKLQIDRWKACERSGEWPSYDGTIQPMAMPDYLADRAAVESER